MNSLMKVIEAMESVKEYTEFTKDAVSQMIQEFGIESLSEKSGDNIEYINKMLSGMSNANINKINIWIDCGLIKESFLRGYKASVSWNFKCVHDRYGIRVNEINLWKYYVLINGGIPEERQKLINMGIARKSTPIEVLKNDIFPCFNQDAIKLAINKDPAFLTIYKERRDGPFSTKAYKRSQSAVRYVHEDETQSERTVLRFCCMFIALRTRFILDAIKNETTSMDNIVRSPDYLGIAKGEVYLLNQIKKIETYHPKFHSAVLQKNIEDQILETARFMIHYKFHRGSWQESLSGVNSLVLSQTMKLLNDAAEIITGKGALA